MKGPWEHPPRFGVLIGEFAHDLRSLLDNLVWQLVIANGQEPREGPRGNGFPPFRDPKTQDEFFRATANAKLHGVRRDAATLIEAFQPYNGGDNLKLALLDDIWTGDKHKVIHTTNSHVRRAPTVSDLSVHGMRGVMVDEHEVMLEGRMKDDTPIARFRLVDPPETPKLYMNFETTVDIAFGDGTLVLPTLKGIGTWVALILRTFAERFFEPLPEF